MKSTRNGYLIAICLTAVLLPACEQPEPVQTDIYTTAPASRRTISISVEAAGIIEAETTVEVKSKASGEILAINAEIGDTVEETTLLVQIDKRTPRNNLDQAQADLDAALARRKIARTQLERTRNLLDKGIVTDVEYESGELELANAEALVISRQVGLENARIALDDTDVKAPITGTIIEKNVERGQVISSPIQDVGGGTILLKMADLGSVLVRTLVDETDIGKIRPDMPVTVKVAAYPNQPFSGNILKIEPLARVEQNVTLFPVIIRLENTSGLLKPGMNAEVEINIARGENVLAIPTIALRTDRDIATTASVLGIAEDSLRTRVQPRATAPSGPGENLSTQGENRMANGTRPDVDRTATRPPNGGRRVGGTDYLYGGSYWVLLVENETLVPRAVKTGLTDHEYSEIVSGLKENDAVLIMPTSGLIERQQRMQQAISSRMTLPGMGGNR